MSEPAWPLLGHADAEKRALQASRSGQVHHAWLLEGRPGLGKSRFALRFAAHLLGARDAAGGNGLDVASSDPIVEKIRAGAHPDLRCLERTPGDTGKLPLFVPVDAVRRDVIEFLTLKPALGGRRVCIVDAVDDLNESGANALLKSLEEPPSRSVLILLHHGVRALLPTLRSRCRRLRFRALSDEDIRAAIALAGGDVSARAIELADGRPGLALALSSPDAADGIAGADTLLEGVKSGKPRDLAGIYTRASRSEASFRGFATALLSGLASLAEDRPALSEAWLTASRILEHAERDTMDRGQTSAKLVASVFDIAKAA